MTQEERAKMLYGKTYDAAYDFIDTLETNEQKEAFAEFLYQLLICINNNRNEFVEFANEEICSRYSHKNLGRLRTELEKVVSP